MRELVGQPVAIEAARHFRTLRALGISLRSQIDLLIGTFCTSHDHELLHADRDCDQTVRHLGLRVAAASRPPH